MTSPDFPHHALAAWQPLIAHIASEMARRGAHPARTVVLLPYAQLMPLASRLWAQARPDGFAPRFETTRNWSRQFGALASASHDLAFDAARDILTAQSLLERAGLGAHREVLAGSLVEAASHLASLAAAVPPADREAWAAQAWAAVDPGERGEGGVLVYEAAVARVAVAWAAATSYATDVLFDDRVKAAVDCLVVLQGFQSDPLTQALLARFADRASELPLPSQAQRGVVRLQPAHDAEDEAQRAAACVLRHIEDGRVPVALAATDRALTRRISAMLGARQVTVRDENGWKLSTTRAAAQFMSTLRACAWNASSDAVLDWLKHAPAFMPDPMRALEKWLRRSSIREWRSQPEMDSMTPPALLGISAQANALRESLQRARPLTQWLTDLRALLKGSGQWDLLTQDAAGARVLAVLRLGEGDRAELEAWAQASTAVSRRMSLADFTAWVNEVLEAASYVPEHPLDEQVVILPLSQVLGRPFAALVLPGCDEVRLQPSPEPPGPWTGAQRAGLALPSREVLAAADRAAWHYALQTPHCDVLWRTGDDAGEPLLPSPYVQALLQELAHDAPQPQATDGPSPLLPASDHAVSWAVDPRGQRALTGHPVPRPLPVGQELPVTQLSASAYGDLRSCPYRFFALRQLGLQESDELESEIGKRDFGLWLHAVLRHFHEDLQQRPAHDLAERTSRIDLAASVVTRQQGLDAGEFLPFAAAWPRVRSGYLAWLEGHEKQGAAFEAAEVPCETPLGPFKLVGRIDRVDRLPDGQALLIDYKTEGQAATRERIRNPAEDTQLAFYAALLPDDTLRAAYVNVGEKEPTKAFEQADVVHLRDQVIESLLHDLARIADGTPLPALGEGAACDYCAARGLCRKDFWSTPA